MISAQWEEGYAAFGGGLDASECPYSGDNADEWRIGFDCAVFDAERRARSGAGLPSIEVMEAAVGSPIADWAGRCYEVACALVDKGVIEGRAAYGDYLGRVCATSIFAKRGLIQHGWIVTPDGHVVDPTRWVFEGDRQFVYKSPLPAPSEYDEGGNARRLHSARPVPPFNPNEKCYTVPEQFRETLKPWVDASTQRMSVSQVFALANSSLHFLGTRAPTVFEYIESIGQSALIPYDNLNLVRVKSAEEFT